MKPAYKRICILVGIAITLIIMSTAGYTIFNTEADSKTKETTEKNSSLTMEKLRELYDKGYSVLDIETADELSSIYSMDIEKVLEIKGVPDYRKESGNADSIKDESRSWDEVRTELNIKKAMKENGATEEEIKNTVDNCMKQIKEKEGSVGEYSKESIFDPEKDLKNATPITKEEIEKCKQHNILTMDEILKTKKAALKYGVSLDNVLKIKDEKKDWTEVIKELGGGANE